MKTFFYFFIPILAIAAAISFVIFSHRPTEELTNQPIDQTMLTVVEGDVVSADGVHLRYWFYDRGTKTVVVYLHGGPGSNTSAVRETFGTTLSEALGSLLFFDQRGGGQSSVGELSGYTFPVAIDDLKTVVTTVANNKQIILWGHSFGATLAVENAASNDGVAVVGYILDAPWLNERLCAMNRGAMSPEAYEETDQEHARMLQNKAEDTNKEVQAAWYQNEWLNERDFLPLLSSITVPTLVVSGALDTNIPPAQVDAMRPYMPDAEFNQFPGVGHNILFSEQSDAFIEALSRFVSRSSQDNL